MIVEIPANEMRKAGHKVTQDLTRWKRKLAPHLIMRGVGKPLADDVAEGQTMALVHLDVTRDVIVCNLPEPVL